MRKTRGRTKAPAQPNRIAGLVVVFRMHSRDGSDSTWIWMAFKDLLLLPRLTEGSTQVRA